MRTVIATAPLPPHALLQRYAQRGAFTDCYVCDVPVDVQLPELITAFYGGRLMTIERAMIGLLLKRKTTSRDIVALADGRLQDFAAWRVEARDDVQILLADVTGKTCSWLMVQPVEGGTRVCFGSAVVPRENGQFGAAFHALLGFHAWYSKALLTAAARRLSPA